MTVEPSSWGAVRDDGRGAAAFRSDIDVLTAVVVVAGIACSILFVVIGLLYELQMYGDGSIFSYSVAVRDSWAFHWHNISGRLFVYLFSFVPAKTFVKLTHDAHGGIVIYGFLFFVVQLLGLIATFAADRSKGRIIFKYACCSTALLCPLVFGFPTEIWMAHALFWPALAACHFMRDGIVWILSIFAILLALVFTHGGALIFANVILATLLLRGARDAVFPRIAGVFVAVLSIWLLVQMAYPADAYVAAVLARAALRVFDISILGGDLIVLLGIAIASYGIVFLMLRQLAISNEYLYAALAVASGLVLYWWRFDHALHTDNRYYLRTVILIATPALGVLAAAYALDADEKLNRPIPLLRRLMPVLTSGAAVRAATGAFLLVMLIHSVETVKFVEEWTDYKNAIRALAAGTASDPTLGNPRFVSSERIDPRLYRLSWFSTTHFLSILVTPNMAPARIVVDPTASYFWLSCKTAVASEERKVPVPAESRRLVRIHACLHR